MQGLVVVGLIVEKIWNVDVNCVSHWSAKYRSKSPGQGTCSQEVREMCRARYDGCLVL